MNGRANYPEIDFLYLNEKDMIAAGVEDMASCIDTMEELFSLIGKGDYRMGGPNGNEHGIMMKFPEKSDVPGLTLLGPDYRFVAMPAYVGGKFNLCGIKCYGSSDIINKKASGRTDDGQVVVYAVGGMPVEDVAWGYMVLQNAKTKGIGTKLNLWQTPEFV